MSIAINQTILSDSEKSSLPLVGISLLLHAVVFIAVPLLLKLIDKPTAFVRPQTFQLVRMPTNLSMPAQQPPLPKAAPALKSKPKAAVKPVPAKSVAAKPAAKKVVEEDTKELEELLGAVAPPVSELQPLVQSFKYPWYIQNVVSKVESFWRPPSGYNNSSDVYVVVSFTIFSAGTVSNVAVAKSSGDAMLDNLAVRAIKLAAPFGKLPAGFSENSLEISYTLRPTVQ